MTEPVWLRLRDRSGLLLVEVLVALVILAAMGVALLRIQSAAVRQFHATQRRAAIAAQVEKLLWDWSQRKVPITLPNTGQFSETVAWTRTAGPSRIDQGLLVTQVEMIVRDSSNTTRPEIYRVAWLVPRRPPEVR